MLNIMIFLFIFILSLLGVYFSKKQYNKNEVQSQFVITGITLIIFYIVCFISGICTILNFLFRWIF